MSYIGICLKGARIPVSSIIAPFLKRWWNERIRGEEDNQYRKTNQPRMYIIVRLTNQGADLVPATLSFPDINGDGMPDMQVTVLDGSNPSVWVLFNNGTSFVSKL